jgi:hypothetical protein
LLELGLREGGEDEGKLLRKSRKSLNKMFDFLILCIWLGGFGDLEIEGWKDE